MGLQKIWASPEGPCAVFFDTAHIKRIWYGMVWYGTLPFLPKVLMGFCSDRPCEYTGQI